MIGVVATGIHWTKISWTENESESFESKLLNELKEGILVDNKDIVSYYGSQSADFCPWVQY